jgi:hypothetical protein
LNCASLLIELGLTVSAGALAAWLHLAAALPPPEQNRVSSWTAPVIRRETQPVRTGAMAGGITGLIAGGAALFHTFFASTDQLVGRIQGQMQADFGRVDDMSVPMVLGAGGIASACILLLLFPGLCAALGGLGGYLAQALRPARSRK